MALITGGGSGIGLAIAEKFIQNEIVTIIVGRDQQKLNEAKRSLGDLCKPVCQDLNDLSSIPGFVEKLAGQYGHIDTLVNNAGINLKKDFIETSDEDFQRILHTNLMAIFSLSREVVKLMIAAGKGNIINISSMASQYGIPKVIAYTASKSAIEGMISGYGRRTIPAWHPRELHRSGIHRHGYV